jgi:hypothetical protein
MAIQRAAMAVAASQAAGICPGRGTALQTGGHANPER